MTFPIELASAGRVKAMSNGPLPSGPGMFGSSRADGNVDGPVHVHSRVMSLNGLTVSSAPPPSGSSSDAVTLGPVIGWLGEPAHEALAVPVGAWTSMYAVESTLETVVAPDAAATSSPSLKLTFG